MPLSKNSILLKQMSMISKLSSTRKMVRSKLSKTPMTKRRVRRMRKETKLSLMIPPISSGEEKQLTMKKRLLVLRKE